MALSADQERNLTTGSGAVQAAEEYAASELPASERRSTLSITLVRMGYTVSATDLLFGMSLGLYFNFWMAVYVALLSSIAICAVSILVGLIGQREGLTTALIARMTFGREGSRIPPSSSRSSRSASSATAPPSPSTFCRGIRTPTGWSTSSR